MCEIFEPILYNHNNNYCMLAVTSEGHALTCAKKNCYDWNSWTTLGRRLLEWLECLEVLYYFNTGSFGILLSTPIRILILLLRIWMSYCKVEQNRRITSPISGCSTLISFNNSSRSEGAISEYESELIAKSRSFRYRVLLDTPIIRAIFVQE